MLTGQVGSNTAAVLSKYILVCTLAKMLRAQHVVLCHSSHVPHTPHGNIKLAHAAVNIEVMHQAKHRNVIGNGITKGM